MKTLGVIANCTKPSAVDVVRRLAQAARTYALEMRFDEATAALLPEACGHPPETFLDEVDAVVALGGDGTMLRAVRSLAGRDLPVLGVNIGSLGFLTSVAQQDLERAVGCLVQGTFTVTRRAMMSCRVERAGVCCGEYLALNDAVLASGASTRMIHLELTVDGDPVAVYACDGLIVATPTGSTGHSLSAGGPILVPEAGAFVISVICPHALASRPVVLPDDCQVAITIRRHGQGLALSVDGQTGQALEPGDRVTIFRSGHSVRFIHLPGYSYFGVLRQKLHWSGSNLKEE